MIKDQAVKEFHEIIERASTVEQLAIWYVIDDVQKDGNGVPAITPDVSRAGQLLAHLRLTRESYFDRTPEIIASEFKDILESRIKTALMQKPAFMRGSLEWDMGRQVVSFPLPPFFLWR